MWPTVQPSPTTVGCSGVVCRTEPSCTEVRAPISMRPPPSPRSTASGQIVLSAPMRTAPITTASGWTKASGWISGVSSPSA